MVYRIEILPSAASDLARLEKKEQIRIVRKVNALTENPRPLGSKKLREEIDRWRIRVGDYRVIYDIKNKLVLISVVKIGHRREVYRR